MYPILWSFGKINIYSHGLLMALGAIIGGVILYYLARKKNLPTNFILDLIVLGMVGGLIGARLLYFWLYLNQFEHWYEIFFVWWGGLVSFGGLGAALLVAAIYLKNKRQSVWQWFDLGIIGILVGWAIGRIGCFLAGDVVGILTHSGLAVGGRWPIPLFESAWCLLIGMACFILLIQKKWLIQPGLIFNIGLGLYGLGRFIIDFLKEENTLFWQLKFSQVGDLLIVALAIIFIFIIIKRGSLGGGRSQNGF